MNQSVHVDKSFVNLLRKHLRDKTAIHGILGDRDIVCLTRQTKKAIKDPLIKHRYNQPRAADAVRVVSKSAYDRLIFYTLGILQGCRARILKAGLG